MGRPKTKSLGGQFRKSLPAAIKNNRVVWCVKNCPMFGPDAKQNKHETGRKIKGDGDWIKWTPEQLATRKRHKDLELAKMKLVITPIRAKYPNLVPDAA